MTHMKPAELTSATDMRGAMVTGDRLDTQLIEGVLDEYLEMPGLALTLDQARRLWGCDAATCSRIANMLVARELLRWSRHYRLVRVREEA
jgi:hypothetical protein